MGYQQQHYSHTVPEGAVYQEEDTRGGAMVLTMPTEQAQYEMRRNGVPIMALPIDSRQHEYIIGCSNEGTPNNTGDMWMSAEAGQARKPEYVGMFGKFLAKPACWSSDGSYDSDEL